MDVIFNRMALLKTRALGVQGFLYQTDLFLIREPSLDQKVKKIKRSKKALIMTKM